MHVNPDQIALQAGTTRFFFPAADLDDQIDRGLFEIARNTPAAAAHNMLRRVRRCPIDPTALARAAEEVGAHWLLLADRHMGDRAQPDRARTSTDAKARQAAG